MKSAETSDCGLKRAVFENIVVLISYWGLSHLNWMVFKSVGVLPMPIWPAAAVALVAAILYGWRIAPGIALGTILANSYSLGSSWSFACCIAVMNTLGPLLAAAIICRRISGKAWLSMTRRDVTILFLAGVVLAPLMTAAGGIGSKWMLELIPSSDLQLAFLRWALAHSLGTLLFGPPLLVWCVKNEKQ